MKTFQDKVLDLVKKIPKGRVSTYKEIGEALKRKGQVYRAVGRALHDNKTPVKIPCHRVVASDGSLGGYSRGLKKKIVLLKKEGIKVKKNKIIDFEKKLFTF
ncbi:MGMT family protein [Candidatus Woesearchaeota archaeon]|nr:MGMT family protein [Candidatus Woesearchaeota archaeon]